jgi:ABC-2 type transport system ATP-binding protein
LIVNIREAYEKNENEGNMLELKGITKKYNVFPAVDNVSFSIEPGEILGYLGPNGAGKTTTIKMLTGLLEPTSGDIFLQGKKIKNSMVEFKKKIGYVPEEPDIYPHLSAYDYLLMVGRLRQIPEKTLKEKIERFMEFFKLSLEMQSSISSYSKGMVQKVLLSAALLHNPDILLLDEPLSGLDVETSLIIKDLVRQLSKEGKIIFYCSHILEVVEKVCSRVIIIHKGKILTDDSVENLRNLMKVPSLEEIFSQLVIQEDTELISKEIVHLMKYVSQ